MQKGGKRQRVPLVSCETVDAGRLREAATKKKDDRILVKILEKGLCCYRGEVPYEVLQELHQLFV